MRALICIALTASCGGSIDKTKSSHAGGDAGVAQSAASGGAGDSTTSGGALSETQGGAADTANGGSSSGAASEGAAAGEAGSSENPAVLARAESGKDFCLDDLDCDGLTCTASLGRMQLACLAPCSSDADCKTEERCFSQSSIPTSCFQRCTDPTQCEYQYDCADYYRTGDYLCLPSDWVRFWRPAAM